MGLKTYVLEVFDATRYAQPIARARIYYPFIVQTEVSDMRPGSVERRKKCDYQSQIREEIDIGAKAMSLGSSL